MSTLTDRLPVSTPNALLISVFLLGAAVAAVAGSWPEAVVLAFAGVFGLGYARYARRPTSRDLTRLNAIEYRDERDERLAHAGFAVVGAFALALAVAEFVLVSILADDHAAGPELRLFVSAQLLALAVVWSIANWVAVRRS
jgi:hypothetical protein